ncbi:ATP-binding protein [Deinococcus sp. QL22]|uniref:PAS domain-containing sensor histidine kinase n=1 Tax=Deinococcus sp. QL22 TaxID=2939437 RepID=UPI0020173272|nr:ATP-binding protein [Deinococcus sp. QL22]UQN10178.1 ATP-binding protein [Deinococcus sp. QL22]
MTNYEQLREQFETQSHDLRVHQSELENQNEALRQTNLELEWTRNRYADLFKFAPIGYLVCGQDGVIQEINQTGCTQLGSECSSLSGRPFPLFVEEGQRLQVALLLGQVVQAGPDQEPQRLEMLMLRPDGSHWQAQLECTPLLDSSGLSIRIALTDITALKTAQREAEQRSTEVQRLNEELQTFLRTMTLDLTQPQRQMEGFVKLLSKSLTAPDARSAKLLGHLQEAAADMGALTAALTQFFQSTQPNRDPRPLDLNSLVDVSFHELASERQDRQVTLTHDPLPTLHMDATKTRLLLLNLLSNALKFTRPRPEARIHVGMQETAEHYLLSVRDNGVGFDPAQSGRLFGLFERLHSEREFKGQGLGLALVRRIVQQYEGQVWGESTPGEGAVFWVELPKSVVAVLPVQVTKGQSF